MKTVAELKIKFALTAEAKGFITKHDYYEICSGVTDKAVLDNIAEWIISRGFILKEAVGQQYKQEVLEKIKHPNIENVKDTKYRTHKNKDKIQESKKDITKATLNLNNIIKDMSDMETEYFPAWKKFKASGKTIEDCDEFFKVAVVYGYPRDMQAMVQSLLDGAQGQFDENVTLGQVAPGAGLSSFIVNYTLGDLTRGKLSEIEDTTALKNIYEGLRSYLEDALPGQEQVAPMEQPQEFEPDFGTGESIELGSKRASEESIGNVIYFKNGAKFTVDVAETVMQKAAGLEVKESINESEGMFFPFDPPENVTFHMGKVKFPIDIMFLVNDGNKMKVGKVVHNIEPGSDERWSFQKASAVLEVAGGMCATADIEVDSVCSFEKEAIRDYDYWDKWFEGEQENYLQKLEQDPFYRYPKITEGDLEEGDKLCPECEGERLVSAICNECNGSGEGYSPDSTCSACKGSGETYIECPVCGGSGTVQEDYVKKAYVEDSTEEFTDFVNNNEGARSIALDTVQDIIDVDAFPVDVVKDESHPKFSIFFDALSSELEQTFVDASVWEQLGIRPEDVSWRGFAEMVLLWFQQERV
jgi:uncharacterized membrane protein (UPF0127 family)